MSDNRAREGATCPVDHKTREAYLAQAKAANPTTTPGVPPTPESRSWTQTLTSYLPFTSAPQAASPNPHTSNPHRSLDQSLSTQRVVSSIPRSTDPGPSACPANSEADTGSDAATGRWVYPSEKMFFEAMKRKGHEAHETDMKSVVPIHNAVNERAWKEILEWEKPYVSEKCDGPKLYSFEGLSKQLSPKARFNTLLGYQAPFDRHDWIVDRCGTRVEYVIDFYAGRAPPVGTAGKIALPSFYLDVRPKLNSWEGVKMRVLRGLGAA